MGEQLLHAAVLALVGAGVWALGYWGRANALVLVPEHYGVYERERKIRSLRRGAFACYLAGLVLLGAAVLAVV
ncbi:hypothetical protein ACOACQ_12830 [Nocardioides sp. CPCC 206347]|jgi:hypothetical protein|uniref:hypothetical protein n=1 Tax=unclassified Nocardioides TaxID=2615069 RepID=UPI00360F78AA